MTKQEKKQAQLVASQFNELMSVYAVSQSNADMLLEIAYSNDLTDNNERTEQLARIEYAMRIDNAQLKRNISTDTDTTSKFCRLLESTKQNYRIDKALETFHTMKEIMTLCEVSESRIKSHIVYIQKNCSDRAKYVVDSKKFKFELINN